MSVADRQIPEIPSFTEDLKIRYGGTEIAAMPDLGSTVSTEPAALNSLMQQVGPALAQIKAVGDLVTAILALVEFAKAVPEAVKETDPSILTDALEALAQIADKIAPHIPLLEHAVTVFDTLKVIKSGLAVVSSTLGKISSAFQDAEDALSEAQASGNTSLEALAAEMQVRAEGQLDGAKVSVGLVLKPLEIVSAIAQNIPAPPQLPEIPDLAAVTVIDELIEIVDQIHAALEAIV